MPSAHTAPSPAKPSSPLADILNKSADSPNNAVSVPPPLHNTAGSFGWYIAFICTEGSGQLFSCMNLLTDNAILVS